MAERLSFPQAEFIKYVPIKGISHPWIRVLWQAIGLSKRLRQDRADILFSPSIYVPLGCPVPSVVTITDLAMYNSPDTHTSLQKIWYRMRLQPSCKKATRILTISETVAQEIVRSLAIPSYKVIPIHLGCQIPNYMNACDSKCTQCGENDEIRSRLPDRYILVSGGNYPRKNVSSLIFAMEFVWKIVPDIHLVIVGPTHFRNKSWAQSLSQCSNPEKIHVLGFVSDEVMPWIYQNAYLFVFPSRYEGFGLPILEAMASGVPVACSDIAVFHEVADGAASFFDPSSPEAIAAACLELMLDPHRRGFFIEAGRIRAKQFSWRDTAVKTLREIELVMGFAPSH
jgi:glycosyltransferase involved in cell wall biosynthesis